MEALWQAVGAVEAAGVAIVDCAALRRSAQYQHSHPEHGLGAKAESLGIGEFLAGYWQRAQGTVLPNVRALQDAARASGVESDPLPCRGHDSRRPRQHAPFQDNGSGGPLSTRDAEFMPEVAAQGDEIIVNTVTSSAFHSTNIDRILRNLDIQDLIVAGVVTNGCVESAVRSAAELDYGASLVEDATAAIAPQLHEHSSLSTGIRTRRSPRRGRSWNHLPACEAETHTSPPDHRAGRRCPDAACSTCPP